MRSPLPVLALALAAPLACADETIRCGSWLVNKEVTIEDLVKKCGMPESKEIDTSEIRRPSANGAGSIVIGTSTTERWRYQRGSRSFVMIVTIVDGKVKSIDRAE